MPRYKSNKMKIRILRVCVILFPVFSAALLYNAFVINVSTVFEVHENLEPVLHEKTLNITLNVVKLGIKNEFFKTYVATHPLTVGESVGIPMLIKIPSIAVNAPIEKVGLTTNGLMDVPKHQLNTGWYELGVRPGEVGSAAIAGHVDWVNGASAVFANLHKINVGDRVFVQDDKGAVITFIVREIRRYEPTAKAVEVFRSNDGKAHLNIITCDGAWDRGTEQYSKRLVVFTDRE